MREFEELQRLYKKLMFVGLLLLLLAFGLLILKPLGNASLVVGAVLFLIAFIPLELARKTAQKLSLIAMKDER